MSGSTFYSLYETLTNPWNVCMYVCKDNKILVTQILSVMLARLRTGCRDQTRRGTQKRVHKNRYKKNPHEKTEKNAASFAL